MNLNVITESDATRLGEAVKKTPKSAAAIASETTKPPTVTKDDLYGRLLKFIPAPLLAVYVFVQNIVLSVAMDRDLRLALALTIFVVFAVLMVVYVRGQKNVKRAGQLAAMVFSFAVFAFSTNGPEQVFAWYEPWHGSVALGLAAAVLIAFAPQVPDLSEGEIQEMMP